MNELGKDFAISRYSDTKSNLLACFIKRGYTLSRHDGYIAMVAILN